MVPGKGFRFIYGIIRIMFRFSQGELYHPAYLAANAFPKEFHSSPASNGGRSNGGRYHRSFCES